jgi:hypothetical protein
VCFEGVKDINCAFRQKFRQTTEIKQLGCGGDTNPANYNFLVLSATHFSADSVRCQCVVILAWQFVVAEQMNSTQFRENVGRINGEHTVDRWTSVSRPFWTRKGCLLHWHYSCFLSGSHYLWLSSKEILDLFQASFWISWHILTHSSCFQLNRRCTKSAAVLRVQIARQNAPNWPRWNFRHISKFTDSVILLF